MVLPACDSEKHCTELAMGDNKRLDTGTGHERDPDMTGIPGWATGAGWLHTAMGELLHTSGTGGTDGGAFAYVRQWTVDLPNTVMMVRKQPDNQGGLIPFPVLV
jgi:hypothetical protein